MPKVGFGFQEMTKEQLAEVRARAAETKKARGIITPRFNVMKAIRYKCLDCSAGNAAEVHRCEIKECSLWEYRFGKRPTKEIADEARSVRVHGKDL